MGGPVYRYDADSASDVKFPQEYDGDFFAGEFGRRWIKRIETGGDGTVQSVNAFPWNGTQVMDMAFGPDGALYVLDYGTGYFNGDHNSALYRIEHVTGGRAPLAQAAANRTSGLGPLTVAFSSAGTSDPDGDALSYAWTFGDGATSTAADPSHTYTANGQYTATLEVTDPSGKSATASVRITVGNTAPTVRIDTQASAHGGRTVGEIRDGDRISFTPYSLDNASLFTARVSSAGSGGTIEIRAGPPAGTLLGTATVPVTGGWDVFRDVTAPLSGQPAGSTTLHLVFKGGAGPLFDVDEFSFDTGSAPARTGEIRGVKDKCLDVDNAGTADGTRVQIYACNSSAAQRWTVSADGTLRALGKCLDVSGGGTADGTRIQLWTCNGTGSQVWAAQSDGTVRNSQSGKCLDASGGAWEDRTPVHLWTCHTGPNQKWTLP